VYNKVIRKQLSSVVNLKALKKQINNYLIPILVILNIILIIQFEILPNRILKAINPDSISKKDTIIKVVSDNLPKKT
jgi:hypothetical protein